MNHEITTTINGITGHLPKYCNACQKNLSKEPRVDLIDKCYDCAIKGKDLTPKKYIKNLNFVPRLKDETN